MATDFEGSAAARRRTFRAFHEKVGLKPFSPEFFDSLYLTMRLGPGMICLTEQVWAWVRWRTWGNSSERAMSGWDGSAYGLDQTDCALDLYWFRTGKSPEYVEGAPRELRRQERQSAGVKAMKYRVSRAFAKVEARGHIDMIGHEIYARVSPQVIESSLKVAEPATFEKDEEFLSWWKVADACNFSEWEDSRSRYYSARKVARARYKEYRDPQLSPPPILIEEIKSSKELKEETREEVLSSSSSEVNVLSEKQTTTDDHSEPKPQDVTAIVEAVREHHQIHFTIRDARELLDFCRQKHRDRTITPEEVARFVWVVEKIRPGGGVRNPRRFLRTAVANEITAEELAILREPGNSGLSAEQVCPKCACTGVLRTPGSYPAPRTETEIVQGAIRGELTLCDCVIGQALTMRVEDWNERSSLPPR